MNHVLKVLKARRGRLAPARKSQRGSSLDEQGTVLGRFVARCFRGVAELVRFFLWSNLKYYSKVCV